MLLILVTMVQALADGGEEFGFVVRAARGERQVSQVERTGECCRWMGGHLEGSGDVEASRPKMGAGGDKGAGRARGDQQTLVTFC